MMTIKHPFNEVLLDYKNRRNNLMRDMRVKALESGLKEKRRLEIALHEISTMLAEAEIQNNFTNLLNKYCPEYMGIAEDLIE